MTKSCVQREKIFLTHSNVRSKAREGQPPLRHPKASEQKKAGVTPAFLVSIRSALSISGGCRSTPTKPVVHADLGGVFVVAEAPASDIGGSRGEGSVAEI